MPTAKAIEIAMKVQIEARTIDYRVRLGETDDEAKSMILAWARIFDGYVPSVDEALEAVREHYRKPNAFPLLPGDVVGYFRAGDS